MALMGVDDSIVQVDSWLHSVDSVWDGTDANNWTSYMYTYSVLVMFKWQNWSQSFT